MSFIKHIKPTTMQACNSPEHNPPSMIVLPGGIHIWKCPDCGQKSNVYVPEVTL